MTYDIATGETTNINSFEDALAYGADLILDASMVTPAGSIGNAAKTMLSSRCSLKVVNSPGVTVKTGQRAYELPGVEAINTRVGTNTARELGIQGEKAVGITGPKIRIPSLTSTAKYRIPDKLTSTTLTEVKNVNHLSLTRQIKDFHMYSTQFDLQFHLYTRPTTTFSPALQNLIDEGSILPKPIPGL